MPSKTGSFRKDKCRKCKKKYNPEIKTDAICCNGCNEWYHAACAGIEAADLPILKKYESVHWYCKICNTRASQLLPKKFIDAVDKISRKQDANETARIEDYQQLKVIKESSNK